MVYFSLLCLICFCVEFWHNEHSIAKRVICMRFLLRIYYFIVCQFLYVKLFESPLCIKSVFINKVALPFLGQWAKTVTVSQQSAMLLNFIKRADKVQPHEVKLIHCKIPYRKIYFGQSFFSDRAAHTWNSIPTELRNITSLKSF